MASINKFELRNVVKFRGHDQEPLMQADIYYNGDKVGFYSEDFCGGENVIDFINATYSLLAEKMAEKYFSHHPIPVYSRYGLRPGVSEFFEEIFYLASMELDFIERCGINNEKAYGIIYYNRYQDSERKLFRSFISTLRTQKDINFYKKSDLIEVTNCFFNVKQFDLIEE